MNKKAILVFVVILAAIGFAFLPSRSSDRTDAQPSNHVYSEGSSGVVFVEYGDFQCPACRSYYPAVKEMKEKYKGIVTFQFRHFPLEAIHKNARAAARAAEAAAIQGKFWEMHDQLFDTQAAWQDSNDPLSIFESYASTIGIEDIEKFKTDMRSSEVNAIITADLNEGRALGANSTPTFVLNDKKLEENPQPTLESLSELLDNAIREAGGTPPTADGIKTEESETDQTEETSTNE